MDWLVDQEDIPECPALSPWKVVIVDDDPEVHNITQLSLADFKFEGKEIEFVNLYSGIDAKQYFRENNDVALVLLDVVMESDDAGLKVADYLRKELQNTYTRIVLRTGQPGSAPEHSIFQNYDIDGYIAKTNMTVNVLKQSMYIALRSYRDLLRIQNYQKGLEVVVSAITNLNQLDDVMSLSKSILAQISSIFNMGHAQFLVTGLQGYTKGITPINHWDIVLESNDAYPMEEGKSEHKVFKSISNKILHLKSNISEENIYGFYYTSIKKTESAFILKTEQPLTSTATKLLALFAKNVVITMENLILVKQH